MSDQSEVLADGTPARLGRYRLVRPISTGGMARVFEGRRESLAGVQPRVAIKVILPDYADNVPFQELFVHEARIGSMLPHPTGVQIQDFDCEEGRYYLVMEYVEGVTIRRTIALCRRHGIPLGLDLVAEIGRQVCDGLAHAHAAVSEEGEPLNLVHRDIKPSNLMINPQGVVKVLDFGISKALFREERDGAVRGTWGYMAPEQADGEPASGAADLFGLAAVLYELAALAPLFPEKAADKIRPLLAKDEAARRASRLTNEFRSLSGVLVRAFQRDPAARFGDADAMGRALSQLVSDPAATREQLIRLQQRLSELDQPGAPERAAAAPKSATSEYTLTPTRSSGGGLPVAIGDAHGPASVPERTANTSRSVDIDLRSVAVPLFLCVAAAIIAFTGWRLYTERQHVSWNAPTRVEPAPETVVVPAPAEPLVPEVAIIRQALVEEAAADEPAGIGYLTVSSLPRSKVMVDGLFVRYTPMFRTELGSGSHDVSLIADDGRATTFQVHIRAGQITNRVWSFEQGAWMGDPRP
jgi:serine/threonine protein kinase